MEKQNNRRAFIKKGAVLTIAASGIGAFGNKVFSSAFSGMSQKTEAYPFSLPPLPYDFAALEPHIDKQTMQIHHDKHHATYITNLNKALLENKMEDLPFDDLIKNVAALPPVLRN